MAGKRNINRLRKALKKNEDNIKKGAKSGVGSSSE